MIWQVCDKADDQARHIADHHYSRQNPGSTLFTPPGRTYVLKTVGSYWVTSWPYSDYVLHRWGGLWVCSAFRREFPCEALASDMIRDAVAATRWYQLRGDNDLWTTHDEPRLWCKGPGVFASMVTFVDASKVRRKRDFGRCFLKAGFVRDGKTVGGLLAFVLPSDAMPEPEPPLSESHHSSVAKKMLAEIKSKQLGEAKA